MAPQVSSRNCPSPVHSALLCYLHHQGAQKIVSQLNTQRSAVTKLTLNHNPLGDDGVSHLFNYLCSSPGSRHRIALSEINLNRTDLGCRGLQAVSDYIRGNEVLRTLWLASVCARYLSSFIFLTSLVPECPSPGPHGLLVSGQRYK